MNDYNKNYLTHHDTLDDVFQNLFGWPVIPLFTYLYAEYPGH